MAHTQEVYTFKKLLLTPIITHPRLGGSRNRNCIVDVTDPFSWKKWSGYARLTHTHTINSYTLLLVVLMVWLRLVLLWFRLQVMNFVWRSSYPFKDCVCSGAGWWTVTTWPAESSGSFVSVWVYASTLWSDGWLSANTVVQLGQCSCLCICWWKIIIQKRSMHKMLFGCVRTKQLTV